MDPMLTCQHICIKELASILAGIRASEKHEGKPVASRAEYVPGSGVGHEIGEPGSGSPRWKKPGRIQRRSRCQERRKMKSNDYAVLRLIAPLAIIGKVGRGPGLEGKITSSALDKFCGRGGKVNQIEIFQTIRNMR